MVRSGPGRATPAYGLIGLWSLHHGCGVTVRFLLDDGHAGEDDVTTVDGQQGGSAWVTLADPAGTEFCVA